MQGVMSMWLLIVWFFEVEMGSHLQRNLLSFFFTIDRIIYDLDYMDSLDSTFEQLSLRDGSMLSVTADSATPAVFAISHRYRASPSSLSSLKPYFIIIDLQWLYFSEKFDSPETWYEVDRNPADIFRRRMSTSTENVSTPSHKRKHDNDDETSPHKRLYTETDKVLVIKDDDLEILTEVPPGFGEGNWAVETWAGRNYCG